MSPEEAKFVKFINDETGHARKKMAGWIKARKSQTEIGCVDPLTSHKGRHFNPPGGGAFLLRENQLESWVKYREGQGGGIGVHEFCGYMYVVLGLTTLAQHQELIGEVDGTIRFLNQKYGASFYVVPEHDGGARPFMSMFS